MEAFAPLTYQLYSSNRELYYHYSACNAFVYCVQCRLPFHTSFPSFNTVHLEFSSLGHKYSLYLSFSEYHELLVFSLNHIDDVF